MNSCFHFFPVFLCFALRPEGRLTYCHKYVSRSNRYFKIQRRGRQRERKTTISKTIDFARASGLLVHFFGVLARLRHENA